MIAQVVMKELFIIHYNIEKIPKALILRLKNGNFYG